jgi:hypothetical protein
VFLKKLCYTELNKKVTKFKKIKNALFKINVIVGYKTELLWALKVYIRITLYSSSYGYART